MPIYKGWRARNAMYRLQPVLRTDLHSTWVEGTPAPAIVLWGASNRGDYQVGVTVDSKRYILSMTREISAGKYQRYLSDLGPDNRDISGIETEIAELLIDQCRRLSENPELVKVTRSMALSIASWADHFESPSAMNRAFKLYLDAVRASGETDPAALTRASIIARDARKRSRLAFIYISLQQADMVLRGIDGGRAGEPGISWRDLRRFVDRASEQLSKLDPRTNVANASAEVERFNARLIQGEGDYR